MLCDIVGNIAYLLHFLALDFVVQDGFPSLLAEVHPKHLYGNSDIDDRKRS